MNSRDNEGGRNIQESAGKWVAVVWAYIEKRIIISGQESNDDGGAGERRRKTEAEVVE